ncbi:hypothetical protein [Mycobacterium sp.]|uniref:hypothetical protein n=1 Tax=Mycobacterium sp. TaxID=1785 RepID=UPI00121A4CA1|nr:hypothetical protein [Mycobacterium sp.]TAM67465.1 MAG: hypothetical protein EPN51_13560 [Mycobacterium sp.]
MTINSRLIGVWSAAAFFLVWAVGYMAFAQWVPPVSPALTAPQLAQLFHERSVPIRVGMALMSLGAVFYLPWTVTLASLVREIEGKPFFWAATQLAAGIVSMLTFMLPAFMWAAAAFRPERNPEITQALSDLGWLLFITPIAPFMMQYIILGIAILSDRRPRPAFPRWAAYLQFWVSLSFVPAVIAFFAKNGPFAWNGLLVWWVPLTSFTGWFVLMIILARRAVLMPAVPITQSVVAVPSS